ncbi:MAG TPA: DUF4382 domain-containing protein [Nitrospirota bacterium]|nr:DUF4382 domain-containing protein [Nitrospirota bacterium]
MYRRYPGILVIVLAAFTLYACGGGGGSGATATGAATVSLTDAPGDFEHAYITVQNIWFHTDGTAGPDDAGWQKYPLFAPVTVDLIALNNGAISNPIWNNIALPVGNYQQIRLVLAGTEDALTASASGAGLKYNNEVRIAGDSAHYPLRIPDAHHGIRLAGTFQITVGGMLRLAIDVDAGHDVVDILRNGLTEYVLKPSLAYCDLDDAGAIVGSIDPVSAATTTTSSHFVIKAEQVNDPLNPQYHVVKHWTSVDPSTGKFVLYPLKPGTYDIVLRGLGYQTVIAKGVPVTSGSTPTITPTLISMITMTTASTPDYTVGATITSPTGAWVNFYQTLQGTGEVPYEIRFRHLNPITGQFSGFKLSADPIWVGMYNSGAISSLTSTNPVEGPGGFSAFADAILYDRMASSQQPVSLGTTTVTFAAPLTPTAPAVSRSISGTITVPPMNMMTNGILFAVHDGMIVNTMPVNSQMSGGGSGFYTMANLPGGSSSAPLPEAFYGVEALGWSTTTIGIGLPRVADLRVSDDTDIDMLMMMLP